MRGYCNHLCVCNSHDSSSSAVIWMKCCTLVYWWPRTWILECFSNCSRITFLSLMCTDITVQDKHCTFWLHEGDTLFEFMTTNRATQYGDQEDVVANEASKNSFSKSWDYPQEVGAFAVTSGKWFWGRASLQKGKLAWFTREINL